MFLTVTLNAALDKTYVMPTFQRGAANVPRQVLAVAGGKGLNVARVLRTLGEPVVATGIVAGHTGAFIESCLDREGVSHAFHRLASGESRTCLAMVELESGTQTELSEPGAPVSAAEFAAFRARFAEMLAPVSWVVLSGSMPPGLDGGTCVELARMARDAGKLVSLDTSGPALGPALAGAPDVFKPNQQEAEALLGHPITPDNLAASLDALRSRGAKLVALSLGADGAALSDGRCQWFARAPAITAINPVGSGDSFLAALLAALQRDSALPMALAWAVAAGTANAAVPGAAACTRAQVDALIGRVEVCPLTEADWSRSTQPMRSP